MHSVKTAKEKNGLKANRIIVEDLLRAVLCFTHPPRNHHAHFHLSFKTNLDITSARMFFCISTAASRCIWSHLAPLTQVQCIAQYSAHLSVHLSSLPHCQLPGGLGFCLIYYLEHCLLHLACNIHAMNERQLFRSLHAQSL